MWEITSQIVQSPVAQIPISTNLNKTYGVEILTDIQLCSKVFKV